MRRLHGPDWRDWAGVPPGRRPWHLATTAAAGVGLAAALTRRPRWAKLGGAGYLLAVADFTRRRIAPGPRTPGEIATMLATSPLLPLAATWYWLGGVARARRIG